MPERRYHPRAMSRDRRAAAVAILAAAVLAGCGGASAARRAAPDPVVRAYGEALVAGDAARTLELELPTAHAGRDQEAQRAAFAGAERELAEVGAALVATAPARVRAHARIPLADGEAAVLVRGEDGTWSIEGGPIGAPALVSPRDAIASLRSALVRRDLRALEEVLAQRTRAAWEAEVARVIEETADPDALEIHVEGETARVVTPDGAIIELAREADEWRVVDVRPAP